MRNIQYIYATNEMNLTNLYDWIIMIKKKNEWREINLAFSLCTHAQMCVCDFKL